MSTFSLNIETENAAFDDDKGQELARILRRLADQLENGDMPDSDGWIIQDINWNRVGKGACTDE